MIKFTVKGIKVLKEGENAGGNYVMRSITFQEAVKVFQQNGTEHNFLTGSTFDGMASAIVAGEVWEAEAEVNEKDKKFYLNLKKLNKVGAQTAQPNAPTTPAVAPTTSKAATPPVPEINGAARGMAVNTITGLIVASAASNPPKHLLESIFSDKKDAVIAWYRKQLLGIMELDENAIRK